MSRNARSNENGRFDEILSNRVKLHGFDHFGFWRMLAIFVTACISGHVWQSNEDGKFDEILWNPVNVHGFDDFGEF